MNMIPRTLEEALFGFLGRKYVQRADARQRAMGLQYTEAETHDLAKEVARFVLDRPGLTPPKLKIIEAADHGTGLFDWALTIEWPDGSETVEHVSDNVARALGYRSEEAGQ